MKKSMKTVILAGTVLGTALTLAPTPAFAGGPIACVRDETGNCHKDKNPLGGPIVWVADKFDFDGFHHYVSVADPGGWIYIRKDGGSASYGEAANLAANLSYSSCTLRPNISRSAVGCR